ncbi:MAG: hypothetical protein AAGC93_12840 [Cyanobacteria bacterium P01_F01_bin.53]
MKIFQVTQVRVIKQSESPLTLCIQVSGLTASAGWTNPRLDNSEDPDPDDAVLAFSFDADRPTGPVIQVLTPISASIVVNPANGADAVIVSARSNSLVVHASCFVSPEPTPPITTLAVGEEDPVASTRALGEEDPVASTRALGEEDPFTTLAVGEEGPAVPSTRAFGEEEPLTTLAIGEEGPGPSTRAAGEEDPVTTLAVGEEGPGPSTRAAGEENPPSPIWGGPFGQY